MSDTNQRYLHETVLQSIVLVICIFWAVQANSVEPLQRDKVPTQELLQVNDGWVRLIPPVVKNSAAYFVLHNMGQEDITVVGVSSAAADTVMMHDSIVEHGVARMVHLMDVTVPSGKKLEFKPGGRHLMLMNLRERLKKGKKLPIIFQLKSGETVRAEMLVK